MVKTALVTGMTGMVGSHLTDFLLNATDWRIVGLARWRSPLNNISSSSEHKYDRIFLEYGDLKDGVSLDKVLFETKPDVIFHLAAQSLKTASMLHLIQWTPISQGRCGFEG